MATIEWDHPEPLTFARLRTVNESRYRRWHPPGTREWTLGDLGNATAGEVGEACNVIKKLTRLADGLTPHPNETEEADLLADLADELADVQCYLDLLAMRAGVDLAAAVRAKFNRKSEEFGFPERL